MVFPPVSVLSRSIARVVNTRWLICLALVGSFFLPLSAQVTWTGAADSDWDNPTNWDGNAVPTDADDVVIPTAATSPIILVGATAVAKSISLETGAALTVEGNASLTIAGGESRSGNGITVALLATLTNQGYIDVDSTAGTGISNMGQVTNEGQLALGLVDTIGGYALENLGNFDNTTGEIHIFSGLLGGVLNTGIFFNTGILSMGNIRMLGTVGLANEGANAIFNNQGDGEISIAFTSGDALANRLSATFNNEADIRIGIGNADVSVEGNGINNEANFSNKLGGHILVDSVAYDGIHNQGDGVFTNSDTIQVGLSQGIFDDGIENSASFVNNAGGVIFTFGIYDDGVFNEIGGIFTNKGEIGCLNTGDNGVRNDARFLNDATGNIFVDFAFDDGVDNQPGGYFVNSGSIRMGDFLGIFDDGLINYDTFINASTGAIHIFSCDASGIAIVPDGYFVNRGEVVINGGSYGIYGDGIYNESSFRNESGSIHIDGVEGAGIANIAGIFENAALIDIGDTLGILEDGIYNDAEFFNYATGTIRVDSADFNGIYNCSCSGLASFDNQGTIRIGETSTIGENGIANESHFRNHGGGLINIDRTTFDGIYGLDSIFINAAQLNIGTAIGVGDNGVNNLAEFVNQSGGTLDIGITQYDNGVLNDLEGKFTNNGMLKIGTSLLADLGDDGIENLDSFINTGTIFIDRAVDGVLNDGGTFYNLGALSIGFTGNISGDGINNHGDFTHKNNTITIDRCTSDNGIENHGDFTNEAALVIGANAPIEADGIENRGNFVNQGNGDITVQQSARCLNNRVNGVFDNKAKIHIFDGTTVGLQNAQTFTNSACARLIVDDNVINSSIFNNLGYMRVTSAVVHTNTGTFTNNGVLEYPNNTPIPSVINNDVIASQASGVCGADNVLTIGGANSFTIAGTWHKDAALTQVAGTYNASTNIFTPTNLSGPPPHTVYFAATDVANNCTLTASVRVTINDAVPPTISCPPTVTRTSDANQCGATVVYSSPVAADNCGSAVLTLVSAPNTASGGTFAVGTTAVIWKATDAANSSVTCSFSVTVTDVEAPTITCPANQVRGTGAGTCSALVSYPTPAASDNCALASGQPVWVSGGTGHSTGTPNSSATFAKGITTVVWRATDAAGFSRTCSFRVLVNDTQAPSMTCPGTITADAAPNACTATITYSNPTYTDNCSPTSGTSVRTSGPASGSAFPVGTTNVVFRATDASSNATQCMLQVIVTDNQAPTINCQAPIVVTGSGTPCTAPVFYSAPTASDNCAGALSPFLVSGLASGSAFPAGVTVNTWRAVAPNGQSTECTVSITVNCPTGQDALLERTMAQTTVGALDLSVQPNPATNHLRFEVSGLGEQFGTLSLLDGLGRALLHQSLAPEQANGVLDVSPLPAGCYQLRVRTATAVVTKGIVLVK